MKAGTAIAVLGFLIMPFGIVFAPFIIIGLILMIAGAIANIVSAGKKEQPQPLPPPPPTYETNQRTDQQNVEPEIGQAEVKAVQEPKEQVEEYRRILESTRAAYEQLEEKVKRLEDEIRVKDEIISKLEKELELKEKTEQKYNATEEEGKVETLQHAKKAPKVRLITYDLDLAIYDYIVAHQGTINLRKAARDLGLSIEQLKEAIERLKKEGKLTET